MTPAKGSDQESERPLKAKPSSRSLLGSIPKDTSDLRKGPRELKVRSCLQSCNQTSPSADIVTSVGLEASDNVLGAVKLSPLRRQELLLKVGPGPNRVGPGPNRVGPSPNRVGPGPNRVGPGPNLSPDSMGLSPDPVSFENWLCTL